MIYHCLDPWRNDLALADIEGYTPSNLVLVATRYPYAKHIIRCSATSFTTFDIMDLNCQRLLNGFSFSFCQRFGKTFRHDLQ